MAKSQSTKRKTKEAAIKTRVKDLRKKTKHERSVASAPVSDVTEVKRRKASGDFVKNKSSEDVPTPAKQEGEGAGGEESLSPEERRVLERKLKKIRRKAEKKKLRELGKSEAEESKMSSAQTHSLEYLKCWSEKREEWKFQKTRQVWLLQHMYDSDKVSDAHFKVLLSYLEGLCGVARETTVQKAEALVRWGEGPQEAGGKSTDSQKMVQRAREVVQILS